MGLKTPTLRWKASDVVKDGSNRVSKVNEQIIGGSGYDMEEATNMPLWVNAVAEFNGKDVLRFNADAWIEAVYPSAYSQPNTIMIIWNITGASAGYMAYSDTQYHPHGLCYTAGTPRLLGGNYEDFVLAYSKTAPFDPILSCLEYNGANSKHYENGVLKASGAAENSDTAERIKLGTWYNNGFKLIGDIAEVVFFNGLLTDDEKQAWNVELLGEYLPNDLPFSKTDTIWNATDSKYELTEESPGVYHATGSLTFRPTPLSPVRYNTNIDWTEVVDADTTIEVYTAITNDADTEPTTEWELQAKDDVINGFEEEIPSGMYLWVKVDFATDDTSKTPQINIPTIELDAIAPIIKNVSIEYGDKTDIVAPVIHNIETGFGDRNQLPKVKNIFTEFGERNQLPKIYNIFFEHECSDYVRKSGVPLFYFGGF